MVQWWSTSTDGEITALLQQVPFCTAIPGCESGGARREGEWQKLTKTVQPGCPRASDPDNTRKGVRGEVWVSGERTIHLFFFAIILCLENVFIAPCSQFMPLSLATVPEKWDQGEETGVGCTGPRDSA